MPTDASRRNPDAIPPDLDASDWFAVRPFIEALLARDVRSGADLERWLRDRSELDAACSEAGADLYIAMTRRTDDEAASSAWTRYLDDVAPELRRAAFSLDQRQAALRSEIALDERRHQVLDRDTLVEIELFRDENVPLQTRLSKLDQEYERICGGMTVEFDGAERTLPQMSRYLQERDRRVREAAWRTVSERRLVERDRIEHLFDEMASLRDQVAANAGFDNYRDYAFREKKRFDYGPDACETLHLACEQAVAPAVRALDEKRRNDLGVDTLRPWDLSVDPRGRPPLRPFGTSEELIDGCQRIFDRMGGGLGGLFESLRSGDALDLASRKGKAPGGYQYMRDRSRRPFIFMNAAGLHSDVRTLLHEAGHAFHSLLCADEPLVHYRHSPIEFAEVASMAMELLSMDFWDEFYESEEDLARAKREQLEGTLELLPWVATIDAFQHWIYLNPAHDRAARRTAWEGLMDRFGRAVSWEGLEEPRAYAWQRQGHLFGAPFYYIEYAIAQLGALQLWAVSRAEGLGSAVERYRAGLSLGGSRPLPELFEAAGLRFDFGPATVERLVGEAASELATLPA